MTNDLRKTPVPAPKRRRYALALAAGIVLVALATGVTIVHAITRTSQPQSLTEIRPSGIPASISTQLASEMALSPVPDRPAPSFTLVDQLDRTVSLSGLKNKVVVLEFMDPHCIDICPIVAREFVDAYRDLGSQASKVVFVGVNVNPYYRTPAEVLAFSRAHGLTVIPSWHFLTGTVTALQIVWKDYGIKVIVPKVNGDIIHTSVVYFIDRHGNERYLASPIVEHTASGKAFLPVASINSWGQGIASVARQLIG